MNYPAEIYEKQNALRKEFENLEENMKQMVSDLINEIRELIMSTKELESN